jgi:hypothetical protein
MAHNVRIRTIGGWAATTIVTPAEFEAFDAAQFAAINGDAGGAWAPTSQISIQGTFGLYSRFLRGGDTTGSNTPAFICSGAQVSILGDIEFDGGFIFQGPDPAEFDGGAIFASQTTSGTATFNGNTTFNDDVVMNQTLTVEGGDVVLTGTTAVKRLAGTKTGACRIGGMAVNAPTGGLTLAKDPRVVIAKFATATPSTGQTIILELLLNYNVSLTNLNVRLRGDISHTSIAGMSMPTLGFYAVDFSGNQTTIDNATATAVSNAAYVAGYNTLMSFTAFVPSKDRRYILEVSNEGGTNSVGGLQIVSVEWQGNVLTYGVTGEI